MIVFDLTCSNEHRFEAWFRSSDDYEHQRAEEAISCPMCSDTAVHKAITAPNLAISGSMRGDSSLDMADVINQSLNAPALPRQLEQELQTVFEKVRAHVEQNCEYVGEDFAEEARRMHYGESEARGIYGEATAEETAELIDEGIDVMPMPGRPVRSTDA